MPTRTETALELLDAIENDKPHPMLHDRDRVASSEHLSEIYDVLSEALGADNDNHHSGAQAVRTLVRQRDVAQAQLQAAQESREEIETQAWIAAATELRDKARNSADPEWARAYEVAARSMTNTGPKGKIPALINLFEDEVALLVYTEVLNVLRSQLRGDIGGESLVLSWLDGKIDNLREVLKKGAGAEGGQRPENRCPKCNAWLLQTEASTFACSRCGLTRKTPFFVHDELTTLQPDPDADTQAKAFMVAVELLMALPVDPHELGSAALMRGVRALRQLGTHAMEKYIQNHDMVVEAKTFREADRLVARWLMGGDPPRFDDRAEQLDRLYAGQGPGVVKKLTDVVDENVLSKAVRVAEQAGRDIANEARGESSLDDMVTDKTPYEVAVEMRRKALEARLTPVEKIEDEMHTDSVDEAIDQSRRAEGKPDLQRLAKKAVEMEKESDGDVMAGPSECPGSGTEVTPGSESFIECPDCAVEVRAESYAHPDGDAYPGVHFKLVDHHTHHIETHGGNEQWRYCERCAALTRGNKLRCDVCGTPRRKKLANIRCERSIVGSAPVREKWAAWVKKVIEENKVDFDHEFEDDECKNCGASGPLTEMKAACPYKMGILVGMQLKEDQIQNESLLARTLKTQTVDNVVDAASGMVEYWRWQAQISEKDTAKVVAYILEGLLETHSEAGIDLIGTMQSMVVNYRSGEQQALDVIERARKVLKQ